MGPRAPYGTELPAKDASWAPLGPYGAELLPKGATWAPLGPLLPKASTWAGIAHKWRHMGPLGPYGPNLAPSTPGQLQRSSQGRFFPARKRLFWHFWFKNGQKEVESEGVRPIWRDPQRNSVQNPASDVQNGGMATHLVNKNVRHWVGLGSGPGQHTLEARDGTPKAKKHRISLGFLMVGAKNIDFPQVF